MLDALRTARTRILALFFATPLLESSIPRERVHIVNVTELRTITHFIQNWSFIQDDNLTDSDALAGNTAGWSMVTLPHTWNAKDAAGVRVTKPTSGVSAGIVSSSIRRTQVTGKIAGNKLHLFKNNKNRDDDVAYMSPMSFR